MLVFEPPHYPGGVQVGFVFHPPNVRLTERYHRVSADYIHRALAVDDPSTWTRPWTFMIRLKRSDGQVYEYACHEGNVAMTGILAGARAKERAAAQKAAK